MRIDLVSHKSLEQVRAFLEWGLGADGSEPLLPEREEQYGHIQTSLVRSPFASYRLNGCNAPRVAASDANPALISDSEASAIAA